MGTSTFRMRCAQLDLLRRDLIEVYRSLENGEVFMITPDPKAPANRILMIHHAITNHRQTCPICKLVPYSEPAAPVKSICR